MQACSRGTRVLPGWVRFAGWAGGVRPPTSDLDPPTSPRKKEVGGRVSTPLFRRSTYHELYIFGHVMSVMKHVRRV
jgi:hypothetical protein